MVDERVNREIGRALRQVLLAGREMQSAMARRLGVRVTDLQAVDQVASASSPVGTVELGTRLGIRSASAAVLVDRLVEMGHLTRSADPHDKRRVMLAVTDHARTEVRHVLAPLVDRVAEITADLDDEQAAVVLSFLTDVITAMREYEPVP